VLRSIRRVNTPPKVSIPSERGVTSKEEHLLLHLSEHPLELQRQVLLLHQGFTPLCGSRPKKSLTVEITFGILVIPPTSTTSFISVVFRPASFRAFLHGSIVAAIRSSY
jgi:hypothetical protein